MRLILAGIFAVALALSGCGGKDLYDDVETPSQAFYVTLATFEATEAEALVLAKAATTPEEVKVSLKKGRELAKSALAVAQTAHDAYVDAKMYYDNLPDDAKAEDVQAAVAAISAALSTFGTYQAEAFSRVDAFVALVEAVADQPWFGSEVDYGFAPALA